MALKSWKLCRTDDSSGADLGATGLPEIVLTSLLARGISSPQDAEEFLSSQAQLSDPFLLKDMDKAVGRINEAVENGEKIVVYGDYDCDGITSTAILYTYLESIGARVSYYIPERNMGYGLNAAAADLFLREKTNLIITVDNGISAIAESEYIRKLGIDLIVTDHHQAGEQLPCACAVINPHRSDCESDFKNLCGAGVALKLIAALEGGDYSTALEYFGDLVAIGTVADVVPLESENRTIVKQGLLMLGMTENIGLGAIIEKAGLSERKITSENIAYAIAPRINAAGRMGSAGLAMELIMSEDEDRAFELAEKLNALNDQRKAEEAKILSEIKGKIAENPELVNGRVIVLSGKNWHPGVIGIVSARITERYGKPSVILAETGETATGSARSFGDFSLYKAFESVSGLLQKYGGHSSAAGLTIDSDKIGPFREQINTYAKDNFEHMPKMERRIDCKITAAEFTLENAKALELLEPFGEANFSPVFMLENVKIEGVYPLGADKHTKIKFSQGGKSFFALLFGVKSADFQYPISTAADILVSFDVNVYAGAESVSIKLLDIRPAGFDESRYFAAKETFESVLRREKIDKRLYQRLCPTREETALVYKYIRSRSGAATADVIFTAPELSRAKLNFGKILGILLILMDVGLVEQNSVYDEIQLVNSNEKKDLEASEFLQYLKSNM